MRGFFGIVNLGNGLVSETKDLFLSNYPAAKDFLKMNSGQLFLTGIHPDFPIVSLKEFPELTYAGWCRLDNLAELQQALGLKQSAQEPEVILHGFKKWGSDCVTHFYGYFSFTIWDEKNKSLFLAKDQLGVRPLFYLHKDDLVIFGTSIPLIKNSQSAKLSLNEVYLAKELRYYPQDVASTFFRDIIRLKPAHYLEIAPGKRLGKTRYGELSVCRSGVFLFI
jgi:asparagine synthase (glutamine-hydrolysing)